MTDSIDPQTAEPDLCPNCQHPQHLPGAECETRVDHGRNFHACLCLARSGVALPCSPLMTCQGGTLGYADVWYLQRGQRLQGADGGVVKPDVLLAAEEAASAPPAPADRSGLRERIAEALCTTRRTGYEGAANHRQHRYDARCALCAGDVDALAEALSVLPTSTDRAAVLREAADIADEVVPPDLPRDDRDQGRADAASDIRKWADHVEEEDLRRLVAGGRDEPQAQQGGAEAVHACVEFDTWFDRTVCADPCGSMHQRCTACGAALDGCAWFAAGATHVGEEQSDAGSRFLFWDETADVVCHDGRITIAVNEAVNLAQFTPAGNLILQLPAARALRDVLAAVLAEDAVVSVAGQPPADTGEEAQFGVDDCTCIPFTRQTDPPRYCQPGDTVDMISGWERGGDCPHHAQLAPRPETVHGCPPDGSGLTPCCGRTPFELPLTDRISSEVPVTCKGADRG